MDLMQQKTDNFYGQVVSKESDRTPSPELSSDDQDSDDSEFSDEKRKIQGDRHLLIFKSWAVVVAE